MCEILEISDCPYEGILSYDLETGGSFFCVENQCIPKEAACKDMDYQDYYPLNFVDDDSVPAFDLDKANEIQKVTNYSI